MAKPSPPDPFEDAEVRYVQPYEATKRYRCPACDQDVPPGTHHIVAVPRGAPEDRRHFHTPCWRNRTRRRPGRA